MTEDTRNSFGLYDAPVRFAGKERVVLTREEIERQLDAGAFMLDPAEAMAAGFINPQDETDSVIVDVRREEV